MSKPRPEPSPNPRAGPRSCYLLKHTTLPTNFIAPRSSLDIECQSPLSKNPFIENLLYYTRHTTTSHELVISSHILLGSSLGLEIHVDKFERERWVIFQC